MGSRVGGKPTSYVRDETASVAVEEERAFWHIEVIGLYLKISGKKRTGVTRVSPTREIIIWHSLLPRVPNRTVRSSSAGVCLSYINARRLLNPGGTVPIGQPTGVILDKQPTYSVRRGQSRGVLQ
jgi:hypothetical protein